MIALTRRIQPQAGELRAARRHLSTVRIRLASSFDVNRVFLIGSHARGTAIRWYSDLDMMVVLRRNEAKWGGNLVQSGTLLAKVRKDLLARYVQTDLRRDQQAVVAAFAQGQQALDVVPALFRRFERSQPIFIIPDGCGDWLETSPQSHNRYFADAVKRTGGKLAKLIQLVKWWKYSRVQPVPIQSFHLDMLFAQSNICVGARPYTHLLYQAFKLLSDRSLRGIRDPLSISGTIYPTQSDPQENRVKEAVNFAVTHASAAVAAETVRDFEESNHHWSIVFNGEY